MSLHALPPMPPTPQLPALPSPQRSRRLPSVGGASPAPEPELPLEWQLASGVAAEPRPRHLRAVGVDERAIPAGEDAAPAGGAAPTLAFIARMAQAVCEVGYGTRPASQLTRWVARPALAMLAARGACVQRHPSSRGPKAPDRTFRTVRGIRICEAAEGAYETSAVLVGQRRSRAVAMRVERDGDRFVITAVSLG